MTNLPTRNYRVTRNAAGLIILLHFGAVVGTFKSRQEAVWFACDLHEQTMRDAGLWRGENPK